MEHTFEQFLMTVDEQHQAFVQNLHQELLQQGCTYDVKETKSGYLVSYLYHKHTLANYVCRKSGLKMRIYADHIQSYEQILEQCPSAMRKQIKKASICKRLVDPNDCNPKCARGYTFTIGNELVQKCRFMAFMPPLVEENYPMMQAILTHELQCLAS